MNGIPDVGLVNLGCTDEGHATGERMQIQVSGKIIWYYASE